MFGTWKYDPETDEVQNLRRAYDPITARSSQHQACNRCHEKKLKCSGEKDGCERCIANEFTCEYTRSSSRGSRRGKKTRRRSAEGQARDDSPTSSIATISPSHSRTRGASAHPFSPPLDARKPSAAMAAATTNPPATSRSIEPTSYTSGMDESGHMLDRLDFSMLNPSDGFDINMLLGSAEHTSDSPASMPATSKSIYADPIPHTSPYPRQDAQVATAYPSWNAHDFIMACTAANLNGSIMATAAPVSHGYPITPEEDNTQRRDYYHQYHSSVHEHYMHQEMSQSYWKHRDENSSAENNHGEA